ncbi:hypothetical protein MBH78_20265 [Oceanimonas sp. NS1]|nr:hypothetical protein [Oceanimonas sp. NS1]
MLGVVPYLDNLVLDAEDAIVRHASAGGDERPLKVLVLVTPRISNHTDLDALRLHPRVELTWCTPVQNRHSAHRRIW